jgi:hypothetical protein
MKGIGVIKTNLAITSFFCVRPLSQFGICHGTTLNVIECEAITFADQLANFLTRERGRAKSRREFGPRLVMMRNVPEESSIEIEDDSLHLVAANFLTAVSRN